MEVFIRCKNCQESRTITKEPRELNRLKCPACGEMSSLRASEDLATALEDALVQLWQVGKHHELRITLSTESLPAGFKPPSALDTDPDWDDYQ